MSQHTYEYGTVLINLTACLSACMPVFVKLIDPFLARTVWRRIVFVYDDVCYVCVCICMHILYRAFLQSFYYAIIPRDTSVLISVAMRA